MPSSTGTSHEEPARPPPAGPLPDPPSSTPNSTTPSPLPKPRTIVPKSSTINAKNSYVSPYRQQAPSRSVSTPLLPKSTSVTNNNSPNFKNIVSRFNDTKDEKIPNPSNRIPAVAAGPVPTGLLRTRKTTQWKPAGTSGNGNGQQPQQQAGPRSNSSSSNSHSHSGRGETPPASLGRVKTERSMSAHDIHAGGTGGVSGLQRTRARKLSEGMLRSLPPLDTTVNDRHLSVSRHRRSRSALQLNSPSAASMADTEELDDVRDGSGGDINSGRLRHRRSRSDVGSYGSPEESDYTDMIYTASPQEASPSVVQAVRSGIPLPKSRIASPTSHGTTRKGGKDSKAETLAPIAVSSHGSRRSPQPISSPRLQAYISAPLPAKSPPLRSSRQRLPTSSAAASSRQKFQNTSSPSSPSSYAKDVGIQRGRGTRSSSVGENRGRDIKKKIPELGTVDFAARRARIQSAFNKTLKETNEGKAKIVPAVRTSKHSMQGEFDCPTPRSAVSQRIDEEDEDEAEKSFQPQFTNQADMQAGAKIGEEAQELPTPIDIDDDSDDPDVQPLEAVSFVQDEEEEERPVFRQQVFDRPESQASSSSTISNSSDSSSSFDDDLPAQDTISPMSRQRPFSLIEPKRAEPSSIPLIVTPDSPGEPPFLPASTFLRPNSNWSGYSIDSEYTRESTISEMPAHHMFDSVGVAVEPPTSDQQDATTSPSEAYIPIMLSNTLDAALRGNIMAQAEVYGKAQTQTGLSPVPASVSSPTDTLITPSDTIVGVFDHYDEPSEDFFKSYENTPVDYHPPRDRYSGELEVVTPGGYQVDDEGGDQETETEMDSGTETGSSGETETEAEGTEAEYQDTEAGYTEAEGEYQDETETEGEYSHCDGEYDEQYDSTSCSEMPDSAHPGIDDQSDNQSDGWTSASASPEMEDHPARRLSMQMNDSPTTPRQYFEGIESPLPPTPPPKDSHFLPAVPVNLLPAPVPPAKDPPRAFSPSPSAMSAPPPAQSAYSGYTSHRIPTYGFPSYPLQLPEIQRDTEPLGLAIQVMPDDSPELPPVPPNKRPSIERWHTVANMENTTDSSRPSLEYHQSYPSSRQSLDQYSNHRPSLDQYPAGSPSSSFHSEIESRLSNQNGNRHSETPASSTAPTNRGSSSIHSQDQTLPQVPPEQKMLIKRRHLIKELVDTESSYFRDMTVAMEIYKGSANACAAITTDDIKVLFGNTEAIVAFSKSFSDSLRKAVRSVYVMQRARSGATSSAASISNSVISTDDKSSNAMMDDFAFEEEKDRKTYVGEVFMDMFYQMEKVYGEYCKNHDAAVGRLAKLETNKGIAIWLSECKACAEDLTNAWNLESLLIKPVQRILKYPLLLTQLLECTPRNHPDFIQLDVAAKEMKFVADRINEMKKRKDMVEKIVNGKRKPESDIGHGITKAFARQAEKLKQSVGLSEVVVDETYNKYFENYNMHFVQVQVIIRDIEIYKEDIQGHVEKFLEYTQTIKEFIDVSHTPHHEIEAKWRKFDSAMRELSTGYLTEHKLRVQKHSIEPLAMLLKLHESPQRIMTKRNKKAVDYARFKAIIERGDTPDKKTKDLADAYLALNETLIDELPKLFKLTKKMVDAVLLNFVELQGIWMNSWASKIKMSFPEFATLPVNLEDVVKDFTDDFSYNEQSLNHLGVCNGSMKAKYMSLLPISSPSMTTLSLDAFEDSSSHRRPSTATEEATRDLSPGLRDRAMSLTNNSPTMGSFYEKPERFYETKPERRYSGNGPTLSPLIAMGTPGLSVTPQVAQNLAQNSRNRATSVALPHRSPSTSSLKLNPQVQRSFSERQTPTRDFASRPSSRTYSLAETIFDGPETHAAYASSAALVDPRIESRVPSRTSSPAPIFSSAMPMDDDRDIKRDDTPSGSPMVQSRPPSRAPSIASSMHSQRRTLTLSGTSTPIFVAASLYEFNIDKQRREGGFPYLTYVQGEIFDVVGTKGEIWLAKNQDDKNGELGWIWCKHFAKL